ncbi:IS3 family transposase [Bacillus cereus]|uniref:Transposase n=1 Tax=Bacillus cereus TaxID=1396 RepID=A0A9X6UQK9_BACCE|nr:MULTISPECIES: transposase [Bacillus cereus group]KXY98051.1 transposase [Bacillus cereus]MCC2374990.1 transposase [Bacillus paranthracis]MDA1646050.1 transposase [Bacillus cereus group sp. TH163-1LC]MDA1795145.1 transposase [Bacillus cereus group sp. BY8-1LC]MEC2941336.1 transposase [Bacillus cereus]
MTNKKYDESLKKEIVKQHVEGKSVTDLSIEYKISPTSIYKWIKFYSKQQVIVTPKQFNEVYRENKKLRQEVEILKQAMSIMTAK